MLPEPSELALVAARGCHDDLDDGVEMAEDLLMRDAHDRPAEVTKPPVPLRIVASTECVVLPVDLEDEQLNTLPDELLGIAHPPFPFCRYSRLQLTIGSISAPSDETAARSLYCTNTSFHS
jgi:hypothetical protein